MNAIRKFIESETNEVSINITLPDEFKSRKLEVIILPVTDDVETKKEIDLEAYHQSIMDYYSKFHVDFTGYKFNRDELYDR